MAHLPLLAAASTSSSTAPIIVVVVALVGSGGLGYFLDRRSAQASRLAQDAVSATDVFQRSLEEERTRRAQLTDELAAAKDQLVELLAKRVADAKQIQELEARVAELELELAQHAVRAKNL